MKLFFISQYLNKIVRSVSDKTSVYGWNPGKCDECSGHPVVRCDSFHRQLSQTVQNGVVIRASDCCEELFGAAKNTRSVKNTSYRPMKYQSVKITNVGDSMAVL